MLTFNQLAKEICGEKKDYIMTRNMLTASGTSVILREHLGQDSMLSVYEDGYALYETGDRSTVFHIEDCKGEIDEYGSVVSEYGTDAAKMTEVFDNEAWYLKLMLIGDMRLRHNQEVREQKHSVSYSAVAEDWDVMADKKHDGQMHRLENEETIKAAANALTELQWLIFKLFNVEELSQKEIADELGISQQMVSKHLKAARTNLDQLLERMEKAGY